MEGERARTGRGTGLLRYSSVHSCKSFHSVFAFSYSICHIDIQGLLCLHSKAEIYVLCGMESDVL